MCPNGHESAAEDFCDHCGMRMGPGSGPRPEDNEPSVTICPVCGVQGERGGRYCENCGCDLENSSALPTTGEVRAAESRSPPAEWQLVVACDREHFSRVEVDDIEFPTDPVERSFSLTKDRVAIGRTSTAKPEEQAIDLSHPPADPGISRRHAVLTRQSDGEWAVVDCDSTNGTFVNGAAEPISLDAPVPVGDGDQIQIGAWTSITLRLVPRQSTVRPLQAESSGVASRPQ